MSLAAMSLPIFDGDYPSFSPFDRVALTLLLESLPRRPLRLLEVGSWLGNGSTQVFIEHLKSTGGCLYCVDTWMGTPNVDRHREIVQKYDVFGTFREAVACSGAESMVKALVMSSADAAAVISNQTFDLIFIDADHSYEATRTDISLWRNKVAPDGILCGHDCEVRPTPLTRAQLEAARSQDVIFGASAGTDRFVMIHPGSVLAVDEAFGGKVELWGEKQIALADGRLGWSSIWYVTMSL